MAFPSSTGAGATNLQAAWTQAVYVAGDIKGQASAAVTAGSIAITNAVNLIVSLNNAVAPFQTLAAIPGIDAYAQQQTGIPTITPSVDIPAVITAINALMTFMLANTPVEADGWLKFAKFNIAAHGGLTYNTFPVTGQFLTLMNNLIATIN